MPSARLNMAPIWVFVILLGSYAFFWQGRDWNSASRLMLTYALGDRGTIALNGLERQTGDEAFFQGRYYTDKQPGYSLLALPAYRLARLVLRLPEHPLNREGFARWPADYWVTLLTSGVLTAFSGALLAWLASGLGCGPKRSALVGLAYGLATPAYVYATLAYGHQSAAFCLLASFTLLWSRNEARRPRLRAFAAGFLAAYASIIELSVGPVSAILGLFLIVRVVRGDWPLATVLSFGLGALGPTLVLLGYNVLAYGSPIDMGYAHHVIPRFRAIHGRGNPLGLGWPETSRVVPLLFGPYRGLLFYAPIVALAPLGWAVLLVRRNGSVALVSLSVCVAVFLVNLSYPEWTGGWSTGPRLLLPLLPFGMLAVAAALGAFGTWLTATAVALAVAGGLLILMFLGVGGRIPESLNGQPLSDPFRTVVLPHWRGDTVPPWWIGGRFGGNLVSTVWPDVNNDSVLSPEHQWWQFLPLLAFQAMAIAGMLWALAGKTARPGDQAAGERTQPAA